MKIETLLYILNNSLLFSCFSKSSTSHYFFPISSMINLAIWKSLSITLFIIKTSEYMTQNIGKIRMTLIGLSLLKCTQSVNKYWRICQTVLINKYWGSQQCPKSDEPMGKWKKPTENAQGKCWWTLKKPFKYISALRQTSKLMMRLQRDVYLPGELGKWGMSQAGSLCMWFWGKWWGGRKAGCTNLKFWQSSWQVKQKNKQTIKVFIEHLFLSAWHSSFPQFLF